MGLSVPGPISIGVCDVGIFRGRDACSAVESALLLAREWYMERGIGSVMWCALGSNRGCPGV